MKITFYSFLIGFLYLLPSHSLIAQTQINGQVLNNNQQGLSFVNILMLNPIDSSLVRGSVTREDGQFSLNAEPGESFIFQASMVGYTDAYTTEIMISEHPIMTLDPIVLQEGVDLEEVQVIARKPLFEQKIDRLVVNVANSATSAGGTALEVLERSPGVVVNRQNQALSLIGKEGVVVMINGKISYQPAAGIVQMLDGMSADNIESIELITTPPANYDAEGNAGFINIVLKKRVDLGLNGNYAISAGYGAGPVGSANLSLNYRKEKINIFGNYSFTLKDQLQEFYNYRKINYLGDITETEVITNRDPTQRNHNVRLGVDLELSKKTILGFLFGAYNNKWTMDAFNQGSITVNDEVDSAFEITNDEINQWRHVMGNLNLLHQFDESAKINLDVDYLVYEDNNPTNYFTDFLDNQGKLLKDERTISSKFTPINIMVGQLNFEKKINDQLKYDGGLKGTSTTLANDVKVELLENMQWQAIDRFTNNSDLTENILAAYSSIDWQANEKNTFKLGLRYEYTDSQLTTDKEGKLVDRQFGSLFPTIFYSHTINENQNVNLSLNRRITRPTFNEMAPFAIFLDPNTYFFGNAGLQPAISNNAKVDYRFKSYMLSVMYTYEDSTIARFQDQVNIETNQQSIEPTNLKSTQSISTSLAFPFYINKFWEMQNSAFVMWKEIKAYSNQELLTIQNTSFNINSSHTFNVANNFSLELSAFYRSPELFGTARIEAIKGLNFGLQKKFPNHGGNLRFNITDILESIVWSGGTSLPSQGFETDGYFDFSNRTYRLTYSTTFGSNKIKASRKRSTGSEAERRRVN